MQKQDRERWFQALLRGEDAPLEVFQAELLASLCLELGAYGCEILEDKGAVSVFFSSDSDGDPRLFFTNLTLPFPIQILSCNIVEDKNWVQECADLFEHTTVGALTVVPVPTSEEVLDGSDPSTLYLVPGFGFGSGHHETTQLCLSYMQSPEIQENPPQIVLDMGTGSGVLAIAAVKLYGSQVHAVDIDPLALDNARDNAAMNQVDPQIMFSTSLPHEENLPYDLIVANIYAEVLVLLEPEFGRKIKDGSYVILSGITTSMFRLIRERFVPPLWKEVHMSQLNDWIGILYQKGKI